jgi:uncharacterized membrane protein YidH (DUF202 family)
MQEQASVSWIEKGYQVFFSERLNHWLERVVLYLALAGFAIHLILIALNRLEWIHVFSATNELFTNPLSAIYTPFSFILIYEVYLLIYYLPRSFSTSISKQYEIISLIIIRRIFKDISKLELNANWFQNTYDLRLTFDVIGFLILFLLIHWFNQLRKKRPDVSQPKKIDQFIRFKKLVSVLLIPVLIGLAVYSLANWVLEIQAFQLGEISELSDVNNIFYEEFFYVLVIVDVTLLIISLLYTDRYSQLVRNTGFVISTVLIRLSFQSEGLINIAIIIAGVLFGTLIMAIYNMMEKAETNSEGD